MRSSFAIEKVVATSNYVADIFFLHSSKKAEQAPKRAAIDAEKEKELDVGGILGQRGGPANPVDKDNYPNSGVQG